jgi:hypothetical protein
MRRDLFPVQLSWRFVERDASNRPLKGYAYYDFKWLKKVTTDIGLFQTILKVRRSAATSTSVSVSMHFRYIQRTAGCVKT